VRGSIKQMKDRQGRPIPNRWRVRIEGSSHPDGSRNQISEVVNGPKKIAEERQTQLLRSLDDRTFVPKSKATFGEFIERTWLPYAKSQASAKTFERWEEIAKKRLMPALGHKGLLDLKPREVQDVYGEWHATGKNGKPLSAQTILHFHRVLYMALKYAVRLGEIQRNIAELVKPPRIDRPEMGVLDEAAARRLIAVVKGTPVEVPVLLAVCTGLRRGELCALRWSSVNLDDGQLSVTASLEETRSGIHLGPPKSKKSRRSLPLIPEVVAVLRTHRAMQNQMRLALGERYKGELDVVFPDPETADGSFWKPGAFGKSFTWYARKAKFSIRLHDLRHTAATLMLRSGVPLKVVSEFLGHSTIAITADVYSHVLDDMKRDAADKLGARLWGEARSEVS
jgi:integrase